MNQPCLKLTAYFGERQRVVGDGARFLADATVRCVRPNDVATSVMLRGIASFGASHQLRTDVSLSLSEDPAVAIAAVDVEPEDPLPGRRCGGDDRPRVTHPGTSRLVTGNGAPTRSATSTHTTATLQN